MKNNKITKIGVKNLKNNKLTLKQIVNGNSAKSKEAKKIKGKYERLF